MSSVKYIGVHTVSEEEVGDEDVFLCMVLFVLGLNSGRTRGSSGTDNFQQPIVKLEEAIQLQNTFTQKHLYIHTHIYSCINSHMHSYAQNLTPAPPMPAPPTQAPPGRSPVGGALRSTCLRPTAQCLELSVLRHTPGHCPKTSYQKERT